MILWLELQQSPLVSMVCYVHICSSLHKHSNLTENTRTLHHITVREVMRVATVISFLTNPTPAVDLFSPVLPCCCAPVPRVEEVTVGVGAGEAPATAASAAPARDGLPVVPGAAAYGITVYPTSKGTGTPGSHSPGEAAGGEGGRGREGRGRRPKHLLTLLSTASHLLRDSSFKDGAFCPLGIKNKHKTKQAKQNNKQTNMEPISD